MGQIHRHHIALGLALGTLSFSACSVAAQGRSAETFVWEGRIANGATVEVKGVNGPIQAVPSTGDRVRVEAVRTGRRNDPAEVRIVVLEHSDGLTVCAVYPSQNGRTNECAPGTAGRIGSNNNDVQVEFTVHVPAQADFTARTTNGHVRVENLSGAVEAHSTNGGVSVQGGRTAVVRTTNGPITIDTQGFADARTTNGRITARMRSINAGDPLRFATTNGSITLELPATASVNLEASTSNGRIETDFPVTVQGALSRNRLVGTIGAGGRLIQASTTNGGIRIERAN